MKPTAKALLRLLNVQRITGGTEKATADWWERKVRALEQEAPDEQSESVRHTNLEHPGEQPAA